LIALILAPIGEETIFRGLLLGYMLEETVNSWIAIIITAFLFSLTHMIPFFIASITQQLFILISAFMMSITAGYLRKTSNLYYPL